MEDTSLKVQKSNGNLQDFDIEKIKLAIGRVSDECNESLNFSDINTVSKDIMKTVNRDYKEVIPYSELREVVFNSLNKYGFMDVADAFMRGRE